jgi:hypothetical protein
MSLRTRFLEGLTFESVAFHGEIRTMHSLWWEGFIPRYPTSEMPEDDRDRVTPILDSRQPR